MNDEQRIRNLVERWAAAVHAGDLETVLAHHADDVVMFDVPPPHEGVRGIDAYRETWPPFFAWQAQGASFEITSLEVTAGADVAFAHALLRCGTRGQLAARPETRLRLTLGLVKRDGEWIVTHEHHSFADLTDDPASVAEVRRIHHDWFAATARRDLDALMRTIAPDVVSYEHDAPHVHLGLPAVREVCREGLEASDGPVGWEVPDLTLRVSGELAVAWGLNRMTAAPPEGVPVETWSRGTRVFARRDGRWELIHQHLSFPHDPATGRIVTELGRDPS